MKKTELALVAFGFLVLLVGRAAIIELAQANFLFTNEIISPWNKVYDVADVPLDVRIYSNVTWTRCFLVWMEMQTLQSLSHTEQLTQLRH